jgi:broad specificity phosphatase PhoE
MEIIIVRHGKPACLPSDSIAGHEIGRWVGRYNEVGINSELPPPDPVQRLVTATGCVVASDLRRFRMPPGVWVVLARLAWWVNIGGASESVAATRRRASRVAERLCALAAENRAVGVVGHGMFNRFIAAQLRKRGWRGPAFLRTAYWAVARFVPAEREVKNGS